MFESKARRGITRHLVLVQGTPVHARVRADIYINNNYRER